MDYALCPLEPGHHAVYDLRDENLPSVKMNSPNGQVIMLLMKTVPSIRLLGQELRVTRDFHAMMVVIVTQDLFVPQRILPVCVKQQWLSLA